MLLLLLILLVLASVFFWAGYRAPPHPFQFRSRGGFFVCLALAGLVAYFAWREAHTISELAELIDPVPGITDVTYVPNTAEVTALSQFAAAVPGEGRTGITREERRDLAERASEQRTEHWLVTTTLGSDSVFAYYRGAAARKGWTIERDNPPWLYLARGAETLVLFISADSLSPGSRVLYGYSVQ